MRRCFRHEYLIKTLLFIGGFILNLLYFIFFYQIFPFLSPVFILSIPALLIYYIRITIQRCHDLGFSGSLAFIRVPFVNNLIAYQLFFKKGDSGINEYDKAVNYQKLFNRKNCIDIYDKMFIIDNEEYHYERYLNKHSIRISDYAKKNIFIEYLEKNYPPKEERVYRAGSLFKVIEIAEDEFKYLIAKMNFLVIKNSTFVEIKDYLVFIRKENFKYTIILDKNINNVSKELLQMYNFPGLVLEDEEYIYYNKINKKDLSMWINNVA